MLCHTFSEENGILSIWCYSIFVFSYCASNFMPMAKEFYYFKLLIKMLWLSVLTYFELKQICCRRNSKIDFATFQRKLLGRRFT